MYNTSKKKGVTIMRNQVKSSLLLLLFATSFAAYASGDRTVPYNSHTFLTIRPPFQGSMPEKVTMWRDRALARDCGWSGAFQFVGFGGRSTHASDIGKYFMFCQKNRLVVAGQDAAGINFGQADYNPNARDVEAIHFNIQPAGPAATANTFRSVIQFKPRHSYGGVGIDYKQYLHGRNACEKKWWLEVSTPIMNVRNDVRLTETVSKTITPTTSANANMIEAFKGQKPFFNRNLNPLGDNTSGTITGSGWRYGKICGSRSRTRAADIEVRIGYDYLCEEMCHAEGYFGGLIPTGNRPNGEFVFEPIVGYNFNGGLIWGGSFGWEIWSSCDRYLHIEMETQGRYLFQNTQRRSVDVKGKPWSRYMLVYQNEADAAACWVTEGINIFTPKVEVTPRYTKDLTTALVYTHCGFQGEIGHNFWAHPAERVKLKNDFPTGVAFVGMDNNGYPICDMVEGDGGLINRAITIKENFQLENRDYQSNLPIREEDLDLNTAATPCAITNIFYGSLGYRWDNWCYPMFVGIGGSYELASDFGAISRWMVWGKIGVSI